MPASAPTTAPLETTGPNAAELLTEAVWKERQAAHEARVETWLGPHRERMEARETHPVFDFLFDYYHYRPSQLRRWHPGWGKALAGQEALSLYSALPSYSPLQTGQGEGIGANPARLKPERHAGVRWMAQVLEGSLSRPAFFGCHGLHEWAMVYKIPEARHTSLPLRFKERELAAIVEGQVICCSHYDAFRFFTPEARPLNRHQPTKATMPALEQRGCLHSNMDLYKWAYKLTPFASSELVAEAFALAREIREIDMRASPYDLRAYGFEPIPIETPGGRAEYEGHQRRFAASGEPIRRALLQLAQRLCQALSLPPTGGAPTSF